MKFSYLFGSTALLVTLLTPTLVQAETSQVISGTTAPSVHQAYAQNRLPSSTTLEVVVGLRWQNQTKLDQFASESL